LVAGCETIAGLERELGTLLVERHCRPVRLTDAGVALARHADEVFAQLVSARSEIEAITQVEGGTVSIGTFSSAGATFVADALCRFRKRHPLVQVSIAEGGPSAMTRRVRSGDLDLAVVWDLPAAGEDVGAGLELHHLFDDPWVIVLHPSHPLAGAESVRPADLADEDWLLPSFDPAGPSARLLSRMCAQSGFEPRVAFRVNDCQMTRATVAAGEGVSLIPRLMLDPPPADVSSSPSKARGSPAASRSCGWGPATSPPPRSGSWRLRARRQSASPARCRCGPRPRPLAGGGARRPR
jgi:DNA-binding transcriptional LysR family regulator